MVTSGFPGTGKLPGSPLWERIINGPVQSRRLGVSLGLNIIPPRSKLCSFDCPYCECGFNTERAAGEKWPSPDVVADVLAKTLTMSGLRPDWITFAGNGEPTLHPRFPVVVDRVLAARDSAGPGLKVGILTNGLEAGRPVIREALDRLDARWVKLDPGPVQRVNGVGYERARIADQCAALKDSIIQAMVVDGPGWSGSSDAAIDEWLPFLARTGATAVHLYSLAREPADRSLKAVARERLEEIAARARGVFAGSVEVF